MSAARQTGMAGRQARQTVKASRLRLVRFAGTKEIGRASCRERV